MYNLKNYSFFIRSKAIQKGNVYYNCHQSLQKPYTTYLKKYFEIFGRQMTVFKDKLDLGRSSSLTEEYKNLGFG